MNSNNFPPGFENESKNLGIDFELLEVKMDIENLKAKMDIIIKKLNSCTYCSSEEE